jgi:hypothetical protein
MPSTVVRIAADPSNSRADSAADRWLRNLEFRLRTGNRSGHSTQELRCRVILGLRRPKSENKN